MLSRLLVTVIIQHSEILAELYEDITDNCYNVISTTILILFTINDLNPVSWLLLVRKIR